MVLLGIYLGTTAASWLFYYIGDKAIENRLDREGYIDTSGEISTIEKVCNFIPEFLAMSIPVINFIFGCVALFANNSIYDDYKRDGIDGGTIIKKPQEAIEVEEKLREEERIRKIQEKIDKEKEKRAKTQMNKPSVVVRSYSEMTPVEKLEFLDAERDALLKQIEDADKKVEEGPVKKIGTR